MPGAVSTRLQNLWPWAALLASAGMLAAAHAFERIGHYAPCALCYRQREIYWAALAVAAATLAIGFVLKRPAIRRAACAVLGIVFLIGAVVAAYHAGVEWKFWPGPSTCSDASGLGGLDAQSMDDLLGGQKQIVVPCDEAAWRMAGVSMAGYNTLVSLLLAALSFYAAAGQGWRGDDDVRDERD